VIKKFFFILIIIIIAAALGVGSYLSKELKKPLAINDADATYTVAAGSSIKRVLADFAKSGWIQYPRVHELWLRHHKMTRIQRGEYQLASGMTSQQVIALMVSGKKIQRSIQFIEGKTFRDNLRVIANNPHIKQTITGQSEQEIFTEATGSDAFYEGWMFPDTYLFESGMTDLDVVNRAYQRMQTILAEEWKTRADDVKVESPYQALILASIIEKETGAAFERAMISGVFSRRLEQGMRLQTDPTIIYGLGADFDGNLTRANLHKDSPYNTYTRAGLPPTPIASPGREAIHAALNPAKGTEIFFVAKGNGTHYFSTTLEEHNQAVLKYQRYGRRSDYQSTPDEAAQ
jgi:UPF0755 protein